MTATVVLVVEDEPLLRMAALAMVEEAGFEAVGVGDCETAVTMLATCSNVAVLFTDVDLGCGHDGLWLAAQVAERWPAIRIIVTSGYRHVTPERVPAGAVFFEKPYSEDQVIEELRSGAQDPGGDHAGLEPADVRDVGAGSDYVAQRPVQ